MNKMMLGVLAHSRAGKDTLADYLVARYGFTKIAFADPIKRFCKEVFGFSAGQLWGSQDERDAPDHRYIRMHQGDLGSTIVGFDDMGCAVLEPNPKENVYLTPRVALQTLGTEWGRGCYNNIWVEYALRTANAILNSEGLYGFYHPEFGLSMKAFDGPRPKGVVFSDCRFPNEVDAIQAAGGKVIRLKREGRDGTISGGLPGHASEEMQKDIPDDELDYVLDVPEGIPNYYRAIDRMMEELWSRSPGESREEVTSSKSTA